MVRPPLRSPVILVPLLMRSLATDQVSFTELSALAITHPTIPTQKHFQLKLTLRLFSNNPRKKTKTRIERQGKGVLGEIGYVAESPFQ